MGWSKGFVDVAQHAPLQDLISKYSSGNLGPSDSLDIQRSLSGLSNRGQRSGQPLAGRSTSLMSMPCDNGVASMGLPLEHRSSTLGVSSCAAGAATFLHPMSQRNTNVFGSSSGMGVRQNPQVAHAFGGPPGVVVSWLLRARMSSWWHHFLTYGHALTDSITNI